MRSILVINPKGGCGKTTISTNLASYYAVWGVATALLDYDPQQSSNEWLQQRPENYDLIYGVDASHGRSTVPKDVVRVVMDAPARTDSRQVHRLVDKADVVIIPILPSPIDIRAAGSFIGELLLENSATSKKTAVIANRVREYTRIYGNLTKFLNHLKIPFVTHIRDSQNYIRAAQQGIGVFEMPPYMVAKDIEEWRPLIKWIDQK